MLGQENCFFAWIPCPQIPIWESCLKLLEHQTLGGWCARGAGGPMTSEESRVQNKEEIQRARSCFLPGEAPAAIWLRGLPVRPLDHGLFVF